MTTRQLILVGLAASLLTAVGCETQRRCPEGQFGNAEGECRPLPRMDAGPSDSGPPQSCTSDTDCTAPGRRHCDLGLPTPTCVECTPETEGADCTSAFAPSCIRSGSTPAFCGCNTAADCADTGRPVCSDTSQTCVECADATEGIDCTDPLAPRCIMEVCGCSDNAHCPMETPSPGFTSYTCNTMTGRCIECGMNSDCTDAARPMCDASTFTCTGCSNDTHCADFPGRATCNTDNGVCSQCALADTSACGGGQTCDLLAGSCVDVAPGIVGVCGACTNDEQCSSGRLCVPLTFGEGGAAVDAGAFCLSPAATIPGSCLAPTSRPYSTTIPARPSLNGVDDGMGYCGPEEELTTCAAIRAFIANERCSGGAMCPVGGRCETVLGSSETCTYSCGSDAQCPPAVSCLSGYCGGP